MAVVQTAPRTGLKSARNGIRPFEIGRDLRPVAELIADAFATELDERGAAALREMRIASRLGGLLNLINPSDADTFFGGYVWEEEGRIIGNITVQRADKYGARWQIANVAVAPAWRGRGISRKLMETALDHVRSHGGKWAVLQVYQENTIALTLYQRLGFEVAGGVTDMEAPRQPKGVAPPYLPNLRPFHTDDWQLLFDLSNSQWGEQAQWWRPLRRSEYQSSFEQQIGEWAWQAVGRRQLFRTSIVPGNTHGDRAPTRLEAAAVLTVERWSAPHKLQLWVRPQWRGSWEQGLVDWALNLLTPYPVQKITTAIPHDFKAARTALTARGFHARRTLLTMKLDMHSHGVESLPLVDEPSVLSGGAASVELFNPTPEE